MIIHPGSNEYWIFDNFPIQSNSICDDKEVIFQDVKCLFTERSGAEFSFKETISTQWNSQRTVRTLEMGKIGTWQGSKL